MNLLKNTAVVSAMTMASRVLGLVRDVLLANVLGAGPIADAFVAAFRLPNLFRRFFAEGAFNAAFVPLYAKTSEGDGDQSAREFASDAFSGLATILLIFTFIALLAMPWLASSIAGGYEGEKFDLTVAFTRITFPYLFFISLVALLSGILNSHGRFALAAAAPVLLNVVLISVLLFFVQFAETPGHALVWGVFAAGVVQFAVLVWGCARAGLMPKWRRPRWTPQMRQLVTLGIPGIIAAGITQLNLLVGTRIASEAESAVSILFYADRLYQLPLGLIGAAMGVVLLPDISRRLRAEDEQGALHVQNRAVELSCLLTLPAAVALYVIPLEIISVLFQHGEFTADDGRQTAAAVAIFALGLPAFVLMKVFQPGFFAREDTRTPMIFAGINAVVNIVLSYVLFFRIGLVGIAIGTSVAGWVNLLLLAGRLRQLGHFQADMRLIRRLPRILLASVGMGAGLYFGAPQLALWMPSASLIDEIVGLAVLVLGGMALYGLLVQMCGGARLSDLKSSILRG